MAHRKAFTLLEILIVVGVISFLAVVIFVALDPSTRLAESRNAERQIAVESLLEALGRYQYDNDADLPSGIDDTLRMLGTDASGCDVVCGLTGGDSGGGGGGGSSDEVDHNYDASAAYTLSDGALIEIDEGNGYAQLVDLGSSVYSVTKPYVELATAATLSSPVSLDSLDVILGAGSAGSVEYSIKHNGTDKWWNGSAWITNSGEMKSGDSLWSNVVAAWHFDNDWTDAKGSNNGTAAGDAGFSATAQLGSHSSTYDSSGDYTSVGALGTFLSEIDEGSTFSFWINWNHSLSWDAVMGGTDSAFEETFQILMNRNGDGSTDSGEIAFWIADGTDTLAGGTGSGLATEMNINDGNWHHVVLVFAGMTSGETSMYVDGEEMVLDFWRTDAFTLDNSFDDFLFGAREYGGPTKNMLGLLDEVVFFDKALSEAEVFELYADQVNDKHSNSETTMDTNLGSLTVADSDTVSLVAYLISDGTQQTKLDDVDLNWTGSGGGGGGEEGGGEVGETTAAACLDLSTDLANYLGSLPFDPSIGTAAKTYYAVKTLSPSGILVKACQVEENSEIQLYQ